MKDGVLQSLIDEDFGYKHEGRNWGRSETHSSLVLNEDSQRWYWNSEDMGGDALAYLMQVRGLDKKAAREILDLKNKIATGVSYDEEEKTYSSPYEKLVDLMWELGKGNREYWYDRKLTDRTIDRYRLGYYNGWSLLPLYLGDRFVNIQMRRDIPFKKIGMWYSEKVWQPVLVNLNFLDFVDTIYITEGTVDCLLLSQEGIPAVAQTGGGVYWSHEWYPAFSNIKKIYYIADNDKVGVKAATRVAKSLGTDRTYIYRFADKTQKYDSRDFFKDGGTAQEFKDLVENNSKTLDEIGEQNENRLRHRRRGLSLAL